MTAAPVATYRVQLTPRTDFERVSARLGHLTRLGVSHVYLSPVTESVPGSTHGYDVVDHTQVRDELGGHDGLLALLDAAHEHGLAVLIDHVANHASVSRPELNRPWWTMLAEGAASPASRWFDVDWEATGGKVLLPVLGEPAGALLAAGALRIDQARRELWLGEQRWPLAAGTEQLDVAVALDRQHYELVHWRLPERNVRRFFTIDDLAAVCVEHCEVAHAVDTVPRLLAAHPAFGGVRVDHVDGLADPGAYLAGLRDVIGADRWLLVEKILAPGETLPPSWPIDGTTGYEHARVVEHALADGSGIEALTARWRKLVGDERSFAEWELQARLEVLGDGLAPDVERVVSVAGRACLDTDDGPERARLAEAVTELSVHLGRYRTYLPDDPASVEVLERAVEGATARRPDLAATIDSLTKVLLGPADAAGRELLVRWQQLTGPATAKGVEDRAFFRYVPVSSLCEVGGAPSPPAGDAVGALHAQHLASAEHSPATLLAGTTHDTKRSEDVRARGLALMADPQPWLDATTAFDVGAAVAGGSATWLALQTAAMAAPISARRLEAFLVKSEREADLRTSWAEPDGDHERRLAALAERACGAGLPDTTDVGRTISLAMLAIRATAPGVPDVYQGTEAWRYLLVDPDNRTEPDDDELDRVVALAGELDLVGAHGTGAERAVVLTRLLALRRRLPQAFAPGSGYVPLLPDPPDGTLIAYARLDQRGEPQVVVAVPTPVARRDGLTGTLTLPEGTWHDVLVDGGPALTGTVDVVAHLSDLPALVLTR